jgi:prepilin-type N-terminal cleavage/methylation domain-containing protein
MPLRPRRAFSLVELLAVVAILGVLAALAGAAVFRYQDSAIRLENEVWRQQRRLGNAIARSTPLRLLFIGNSYTGVNDLPRMLKELVDASGTSPKLEYDTQLVGGATLEKHWNDRLALKKLQAGSWDFVVLQEQSQRPLFEKDKMFDYGKRFGKEIKDRDAIPLLYLTWARQAIPDQQAGLTSAYVALAKEIRAEVAPVGLAWQRSSKTSPAIELYSADGSHPTPAGTYLATCTFYGTLYKKSPSGLPAKVVVDGKTVVDLPAADAKLLQSYAWQACSEGQKLLKAER